MRTRPGQLAHGQRLTSKPMSRPVLTGLMAWLLLGATLGCGGGGAPSGEAPSWQEHAVLSWAKKLEDPDPWVRVSAVTALGDLGEAARPALPLLVRLLREDPASEVRARCGSVLADVGGDAAAGPLREGLASGDARVARSCASSLVQIGQGDAVLALALSRLDAGPGLEELKTLAPLFAAVGAPAVHPLRERLRAAAAPEQRRSVALCLGQVGEPSRPAVGELVALLDEPETQTRLAAILALAAVGGHDACLALARTAAEDPDAGLRLEALLNGAIPCDFSPVEEDAAEEH